MPDSSETGASMGVTYFKRYRMEVDLNQPLFDPPPMPCGYSLVPWDPDLLDVHGDVKYECFCFEMDAIVFPCLGDREGCRRLSASHSAVFSSENGGSESLI